MNSPKRIVYYDPDFPSTWIGYDEGKIVSDFMESNDFRRLTASEVEQWMRGVASQGLAAATCAVFAMDIIPEQIFGDIDGNVLFRRYLDAGGRVVWIADIPAWYKGKTGRKQEEMWQLGSSISLLGVAPVVANCTMPVELTSKGRELGLRSRWYSMRPILVKKRRFLEYSAKSAISAIDVEVLAWTNVALGKSFFETPGRWSSIRSVSAGIQAAGLGGQFTIARTDGIRLYNRRCASSWHIVFNPSYPSQGLFRIWDHPVRMQDLTRERLQELLVFATRSLAE